MTPKASMPSGHREAAGRLLAFVRGSARAPLLLVIAVALPLLLALVAFAGVRAGARAHPAPAPRPAIGLSGHVAGLYPGAAKRFRVSVANRSRRPWVVRLVSAIPAAPNRRCPAENLKLAPYRGALRLPPGARRSVSLKAAMRPEVPDACQGALFPLAFRARVSG
jgi:hypothetical protein